MAAAEAGLALHPATPVGDAVALLVAVVRAAVAAQVYMLRLTMVRLWVPVAGATLVAVAVLAVGALGNTVPKRATPVVRGLC